MFFGLGRFYFRVGSYSARGGGIGFFKTNPPDCWVFDVLILEGYTLLPANPSLPSDLACVRPYQVFVFEILLHPHPVAASKSFEADLIWINLTVAL